MNFVEIYLVVCTQLDDLSLYIEICKVYMKRLLPFIFCSRQTLEELRLTTVACALRKLLYCPTAKTSYSVEIRKV